MLFRKPVPEDGPAVHDLIGRCPPLDTNSLYCNLLQCTHFNDTSIAVENDEGTIVGFISGYMPPAQADTLFVWQVAVDDSARGQGLAGRMLKALVERDECAECRYMQTTITPDNKASWALFEGFARKMNTEVTDRVLFGRDTHFAGRHDDENILTIGPFQAVDTHS